MKLIEPGMEYADGICAYRQEFLQSGDSMDGTCGLKEYEDPQEWIAFLETMKDPSTVPEPYVPSTQYLFVREEDEKVVGMINVRHNLNNDHLALIGGHIGYSVAPSERRKGYATQMLKRVLPICRELGLTRVLITCNEGNEGSKKTILHNGGKYESTVYEPDKGKNVERYWIDLCE